MANSQVGQKLYVVTPPNFSGFTVRGGTWEETDKTKSESYMNQNDETFNTCFYDRGLDAKCDLFVNNTTTAVTAPVIGDVLQETGTTTRRWMVNSLNKKGFSKRALVISVGLEAHDSQDLSVVN